MGKRFSGLKRQISNSKKTKKRLEAKKVMLAAKKSKKRNQKGTSR